MSIKSTFRRLRHCAAFMACALTAGASQAAIIGGSASFQQLSGSSLPAAVGNNGINIDNTLFGFDEGIVTLTSNLVFSGGTISAGTRVASHLVFFDPKNKNNSVIGSVSFDQAILGFITVKNDLQATNSLFGLSSVSYGSTGGLGLEGGDSVSIASGNARALWLNLSERGNNPAGDYVRVFTLAPVTAPVPEPSTYAMFLAGILCMGMLSRRRLNLQHAR